MEYAISISIRWYMAISYILIKTANLFALIGERFCKCKKTLFRWFYQVKKQSNLKSGPLSSQKVNRCVPACLKNIG